MLPKYEKNLIGIPRKMDGGPQELMATSSLLLMEGAAIIYLFNKNKYFETNIFFFLIYITNRYQLVIIMSVPLLLYYCFPILLSVRNEYNVLHIEIIIKIITIIVGTYKLLLHSHRSVKFSTFILNGTLFILYLTI